MKNLLNKLALQKENSKFLWNNKSSLSQQISVNTENLAKHSEWAKNQLKDKTKSALDTLGDLTKLKILSRENIISLLSTPEAQKNWNKRTNSPKNSARYVLALQAGLNLLGEDPGIIDAIFGQKTKKAVISFQKKHGLVVDGAPGPETIGKILDLLKGKNNTSHIIKQKTKKKPQEKQQISPKKNTKKQWQKDREKFGGKNQEKVDFWETLNWKKWGLNDYSDYSSFNSAFRNARENNEKEFVYKKKRYDTELISRESSELYHRSKKFLEKYYQEVTPDFKKLRFKDGFSWNNYCQETYGTTWETIGEINNNNYNLFQKVFEYKKVNGKDVYKGYINKNYQNWATQKYRENFIKNLKDNNSYFSITYEKPEYMTEEGHFKMKGKRKKIFIKIKPNNKFDTTAVHELTHKSDIKFIDYNDIPEIDVEKINEKIKLFPFDQKGFDYLSKPSEVYARKMSTLFYLQETTGSYENISRETLENLYKDENKPYDVDQLLILYQFQKNDLLKFLNSREN